MQEGSRLDYWNKESLSEEFDANSFSEKFRRYDAIHHQSPKQQYFSYNLQRLSQCAYLHNPQSRDDNWKLT